MLDKLLNWQKEFHNTSLVTWISIIWHYLKPARLTMAITYSRLHIKGEAIVVAFDICSSSDIIEQLILKGKMDQFLYPSCKAQAVPSKGTKSSSL